MLNADGLPLGLQLIGKPFDEQGVLNAGLAIQQRAGFDAAAGEVVVMDLLASLAGVLLSVLGAAHGIFRDEMAAQGASAQAR